MLKIVDNRKILFKPKEFDYAARGTKAKFIGQSENKKAGLPDGLVRVWYGSCACYEG